jgi:hypothetical protein
LSARGLWVIAAAALAAAKARGVKLGGDRGAVLTTGAREAGLKAQMPQG